MARDPDNRNRNRNRNGARILALALFAALLWPGAARADETPELLAEFLKASAEAYAPYRGAISYLHTGNVGLAALLQRLVQDLELGC